jgi:peptidoglycan/LPS O-acetylase OafA/YrhL
MSNSVFFKNNFDLIRIFAATQVLVFHSYHHLKLEIPFFIKPFANFPGVPIFFVISGFLISASLKRNDNLYNYFLNRALRIFPGLWSCVIISVFAISIISGISFFNIDAIKWFFFQLLGFIYTPDFLEKFGFGSYNGSLWTISIELQFYLVLPIMYYFSKKYKIKFKYFLSIITLIFVSTSFLIMKYTYHPGSIETTYEKILRYTFIPHIYMFLLGVFFQEFKVYIKKYILGKGIIWLFVYLIICYLLPDVSLIVKNILLALCIISLSYTKADVGYKLLNQIDISYGVYIYHGLVLGVLVELKFTNSSMYIFVVLITSFLLAYISYVFIEKPFLKLKKKTLNKIITD